MAEMESDSGKAGIREMAISAVMAVSKVFIIGNKNLSEVMDK